MAVLETEPEVSDKPGAMPLTSANGKIQLQTVTFGYEREKPVLRNLSLEVQPGECLAIVGSSGAGKTTLAGLVPRFFDPDQGRILVDGQDVREVRLADLRRHLNSDADSAEADAIEFDPQMWRLLPASPGYRQGPGGEDFGADVDRVARTAAAKKND